MALTYSQKRFIQKNYLEKTPDEIAKELGVKTKEITHHIEKNTHLFKKPEETGSKLNIKENYAYVALLALMVLVVYANGMGGDFVSDDVYVLINEEHTLKSWSYFLIQPSVFIRNIFYFSAYQIGGLTPFLFRVPNILFHIGFVVMTYFLMPFFSKKKYLPFIVASFVAVHPMMVESVTWISGGIYAQSGFFMLLSFYLYLQGKTQNKNRLFIYSLITYVAAVSSSEKVIIFPFIILLYEFTFGSLKKAWFKVGSYFAISVAWGIMLLGQVNARLDYLQTTNGATSRIELSNPLYQIPTAMGTYFKLFVWPRHLTLYQSEFKLSPIEFSFLVFLTILYFTIAAWNFKKNKSVFFWMLFFFITLWTTMNPFGLSWIVAERYSYIGSIGLYFSFTVLMYKLIDSKKYQTIGYTIIILLIMAFSIRTMVRNIDWKNEDNLWIATAKASPSDPKTHNNLGDVYARHGDLEKAALSFSNAITVNPRYPDAHHNLANIYREQGNNEEAIPLYLRAIELNPALWQSHQNLGAIYYDLGQYDKALEHNLKSLEINPHNKNGYLNIGVLYLQMGDKKNAEINFKKVLISEPDNQMAQQGLIESRK